MLPLPFVLAEFGAGGREVDWVSLGIWAPLSGAFLGVAYLCYYTGLQRGSVSVVTSAASAWLAVAVLTAVLLFGERLSVAQAVLMPVVLVGIVTLSAQSSTASGGSTGLSWGLLAMGAIGIALALMDRATEAAGPMLAVLIVRALSTIPAYAFVRSRGAPVRLPSGRGGWGLLAAAGVLDAGGYVGYNLGVDVAPVAVVAPLVAAHPVATIALAVALGRERPRPLHWVGASVTVAAIIGLSALVG